MLKSLLFLLLLTLPALAQGAPGGKAPTIPALSPQTAFHQWVEAFISQGSTDAGLDSCLPVVFHGSRLAFDKVKPYRSRRGTATQIKWDGEAIFATADPRVALFYTYNRAPGFSAGINLIGYTSPDRPLTYYLSGGKSQQEAVERLFGNASDPQSCRGYIYVLAKQYFYRESGLGTMECISRDPASNLWRLDIDRRQEVDRLVASGKVLLKWSVD